MPAGSSPAARPDPAALGLLGCHAHCRQLASSTSRSASRPLAEREILAVT
jgi:hypothetical protein